LDISLPECSRHLQRLNEALLIERDSDGSYSLTPYGLITQYLLPSLNFISKHSQYFQNHVLSNIPLEFIERIGELASGELAQDIPTGITLVDLLYRNAKEYAWMMDSQVIVNIVKRVEEKIEEGVKFRSIFPEVFTPPPGYKPSIGPERRTLPSVNMRLMLNEKEALICFPERDGRVDYAPFTSSESEFHKWCKDLYLYYWERAKPRESMRASLLSHNS
jgi:predicted transcriptional regulator